MPLTRVFEPQWTGFPLVIVRVLHFLEINSQHVQTWSASACRALCTRIPFLELYEINARSREADLVKISLHYRAAAIHQEDLRADPFV